MSLDKLFEDAAERLSTEELKIHSDDISLMFAAHQTFADTSMGRGGLAGQTITRGITFVVAEMMTGYGFVYRTIKPDYKFCLGNRYFRDWLSEGKTSLPPTRLHCGKWLGHKNCYHVVERSD